MKIIYWSTTILIFLWEGVMPAFTGNSKMAVDAIQHYGYPDYFRVMLNIFKIIGALALILPMIKGNIKEWVYAGFGINFIAATVSICVVDGVGPVALFPLVFIVFLIVSYWSYHQLNLKEKIVKG